MRENKLIKLFKTFDKAELRAIKLFVRSPFYNQREDVIQLFDLLRAQKDWNKLDFQQLFKRIYPEKPFEQKQLAYLMSYLLNVLEEYLVVKENKRHQIPQLISLTKAYRKRGLELSFLQSLTKAKALLQQSDLQNLEYFQLQYELTLQGYSWQKNIKRGATLNLQEPADMFDVFAVGTKLHLGSMMMANASLFKGQYEQGILPMMLQFLDSEKGSNLLQWPVIELHYHSLKMMLEDDEKNFTALQQLLQLHQDKFTVNELRDFYVLALNFGIKRLNTGHSEYISKTFEIYRQGLQKSVYLEDDQLSQFHYKNIAALGIGLKHFDWVAEFLKKYKSYLPAENRENNFQYNMAKLYFEKKDYDNAMLLLREVKYEEVLPNLTAKILLAKIYFEKGEREALENYLNNFERTIRRQKVIGYHRESYKNLVFFMRRLLLLNPYDRQAKEKLKEQIQGTKALPEKKWLLAHLD